LRPRSDNAKVHSKQQIKKIAKSIWRFGFVNPALISDDKEIIAGVGRVEAAKQLGLDLIPAVRLSSLTPAERLAYNLADNRLAEFGRLDGKLVAVQLEDLTSLGFDDIEITGFSLGDIDIYLEAAAKKKSRKAIPKGEQPASRRSAASRRGVLWVVGTGRSRKTNSAPYCQLFCSSPNMPRRWVPACLFSRTRDLKEQCDEPKIKS
jgi:hypothetical protein